MHSSSNLKKISAKKQPKARGRCIRRLRQQERKAKYLAQKRDDWRYLEAS
jgi:hypothetical protein